MDFVPAVVADEQSFELVQPGEGAFDDPAVAAEAGAVLGVAACDLGLDAALAQLATPAGVVVGAVAGDAVGPPRPGGGAWSPIWLYQPGSGPSRSPPFRLHVAGLGQCSGMTPETS